MGRRYYDGIDEPVFKTCSCKRTYTKEEWDELPEIGRQVFEADEDGPAVAFVMKNCVCGSTNATEELL